MSGVCAWSEARCLRGDGAVFCGPRSPSVAWGTYCSEPCTPPEPDPIPCDPAPVAVEVTK